MAGTQAVLKRLEASLRAAAQTRTRMSIPGFDLFIDRESDAYHLSFAVPTEDETAWPEAIAALQRAFKAQSRRARLEYFHEVHPDLGGALLAAGFELELRAPVMVLTPEELARPPEPTQGHYRQLRTGNSLEGFLRGQNLAYGGTGQGDEALVWLSTMLQGLEHGTLLAAGLEKGGRWLAGASVQLGNDTGELAGVWTLPTEQTQGLAFSLCHRLLSDYFAAGYDLCWLSAAEGAQRLYEKLGFRPVGTQLNYGLPENTP